MNDIELTVVGNVVDDPSLNRLDSGRTVANFRIASTPRRFDRSTSRFVDGTTSYFGVSCWGELAVNVATSVRRGQPVVLRGRLQTREYTKDEQVRTTQEIVADVVGHNLTWGMAEFAKRPRIALDAGLEAAVSEVSVPDSPAELTGQPVEQPAEQPVGQPVAA